MKPHTTRHQNPRHRFATTCIFEYSQLVQRTYYPQHTTTMPTADELAAAQAAFEEKATASGSTAPREPVVLDVRASKLGRTHGKAWKGEKASTRRTMMHTGLKSSYEKRREKNKEREAIKAVEKEMKEETEAERER